MTSEEQKQVEQLTREALDILDAFGIPLQELTAHRRIRAAKVLLAVAGLRPGKSWDSVKGNGDVRPLRTREIIEWLNAYLGENISPGSYDDIRRKDLIYPVEAGMILKSAGKDDAKTNDGTRSYAIHPQYAAQMRKFGTPDWDASLPGFMEGKQTLRDELAKRRALSMIPVSIEGKEIVFSPGAHNRLQKAIIELFLPRFGFGAKVLYVGDTADKDLYKDTAGLKKLNFFDLAHGKLPDVIAFSESKDWIYLIEAVDSANPITEIRKRTLEQLTRPCTAGIVFITAFLDRTTFRKFAKDIAWESEVWIADNPDHMIHFNGDKFLGPHS
ncbi:BsuBI/PstI family type II restriction endonuclease [Trinickia sp. NRRL B-1857]|uniref:BsuBI/PstI family type II restriction endonuclease n=1 Tax=Trinickia sp. NRRL B-1857 TaxID=3162879 RepID=UPI003D2DE1D0